MRFYENIRLIRRIKLCFDKVEDQRKEAEEDEKKLINCSMNTKSIVECLFEKKENLEILQGHNTL